MQVLQGYPLREQENLTYHKFHPVPSLIPHLSKGALANEWVYLVAVHPSFPWPHSVVVVLIVPVTTLAFLLLPSGTRACVVRSLLLGIVHLAGRGRTDKWRTKTEMTMEKWENHEVTVHEIKGHSDAWTPEKRWKDVSIRMQGFIQRGGTETSPTSQNSGQYTNNILLNTITVDPSILLRSLLPYNTTLVLQRLVQAERLGVGMVTNYTKGISSKLTLQKKNSVRNSGGVDAPLPLSDQTLWTMYAEQLNNTCLHTHSTHFRLVLFSFFPPLFAQLLL